MVGRTHAANTEDQKRFQQLQELGCVICWIYCKVWRPADISHLLDGGVRIGHVATIPECEWHHRGVLPEGYSEFAALNVLGPSRARGGKPYAQKFGTDAELLEMTNQLLARIRYVKQSHSPFTKRKAAIEPALVASQWTVSGTYAVRTKMLAVAQRVAKQAGPGMNGDVDGVRWMRLAEFERACAQ